jgi:hypothetical protein
MKVLIDVLNPQTLDHVLKYDSCSESDTDDGVEKVYVLGEITPSTIKLRGGVFGSHLNGVTSQTFGCERYFEQPDDPALKFYEPSDPDRYRCGIIECQTIQIINDVKSPLFYLKPELNCYEHQVALKVHLHLEIYCKTGEIKHVSDPKVELLTDGTLTPYDVKRLYDYAYEIDFCFTDIIAEITVI